MRKGWNRLTLTYAGLTTISPYDADDRLTSSTDGSVYTYDANGNERTWTKAGLVTSHDYENRLTSVSQSFQAEDAGRCAIGVECTYNANPQELLPSPQTVTLTLRAVGSTQGSETITWYYVLNGVATQMGTSYSYTGCSFDITRTASVAVKNGDTLYGEIAFAEDATHWVITSILRLTYAPAMAANTNYGYSADGKQTTVSATGSAVTNYGYDVASALPEPTGEFSGGALQAQTLYGVGTDEPLERFVGSTGYHVHRDGLGSITSITNVSQGLQSSYRYDAFGRPIQAVGPVNSPFRYTGREWDANDGLAYNRARYYDPTTGRFLSKDPSGIVDGTDLYAYAENNPIGRKDPSGHTIIWDP